MRKFAIGALILFCALGAAACSSSSSSSSTTTAPDQNAKTYPAAAQSEFVNSCAQAASQQLGAQAQTTCECIYKAIQASINYQQFQALANQINPQNLSNLPTPILQAVQKCVPGLAPQLGSSGAISTSINLSQSI